jgi:hypothetical protein
MNERIRELAKQAENMALAIPGSLSPDQFREIEQDFFAELIMKECIRVPYAMWDKAELNADIAVKIEHRIREHFGVEE